MLRQCARSQPGSYRSRAAAAWFACGRSQARLLPARSGSARRRPARRRHRTACLPSPAKPLC